MILISINEKWSKVMKMTKWLVLLLTATLLLNAQSSSVWNMKNLRIIDGKLSLTPAGGTVLVDEHFTEANDQWIAPKVYENLTKIAYGEMDGVKCMVITRNPEIDPKTIKKFDTAWELRTKRFTLPEGARKFIVTVKVRSNNPSMKSTWGHNGSWMNQLIWYDSQGKEFGSRIPFQFNVSMKDFAVKDFYGEIPEGAVSCELMLGVDLPDLKEGEYIALSQAKLSVLPENHEYSKEGECLSCVIPVQKDMSKVAVEGDFHGKNRATFQISTSDDIYGLEKSWTPFAGPNGAEHIWYANSFSLPIFPPDTKYMRLRIALRGDGTTTPSLERITIGEKTLAHFDVPALDPLPHARRLSASPTLDTKAPFRFSMHTNIGVTPVLTKLLLNDADAMAFSKIEGNTVTVTPPDGFKPGLNFISVFMKDINGVEAQEELVLYIGETRKTNIVTMRDDGMTLVDGKPFFPIGMACVGKNAHNGNSYDRLFQMFEECGMNFARHYSSYNVTVPDSAEFFAAAEKHNVKLYLCASTANACDNDVRRVARAVVLQNNLKHLAWDTGDDTQAFVTPEQMETRYQAVKAIDPYRITTQADGMGPLSKPTYTPYAPFSDNFSPEIYPFHNPKPNADDIAVPIFISSMKKIKEAWKITGCPVRNIWPLIGYFNNCADSDRLPNAEELRAMTYQCIIHGAQGIIWYRYAGYRQNGPRGFLPEQWAVVANVAKELRSLYDVLCARAAAEQPTVTVLSGAKQDQLGNDSVSALLKDCGGKRWLLTGSSVRTPVKASFTLPAGAQKVTDYFENRAVKIADGTITETFAPLGVHVYIIE